MNPFGELLGAWGRLWGLPGLESRLEIAFDPRLKTSLGRCHPERGRIRLHPGLRTASAEILAEVLAHEAAHAVVFELYPGRSKPHGQEWAWLMRLAGFEPRTRLAAGVSVQTGERPRSRPVYEHRCPVCQASWRARRPVKGWRCAECRAVGLEGALEIHKVDGGAAA